MTYDEKEIDHIKYNNVLEDYRKIFIDEENNIAGFGGTDYGDSDDDILAAREVGIRGIRVQRAYNSTNPQKMNGGYGEEVLINSAW